MLPFHVGGFLILYAVMRLQAVLPFNPADQSAVGPDLSFSTAISFVTNANWQNYGGESTMSCLVQMLGLTHQNFLSAATASRLRWRRSAASPARQCAPSEISESM
jgi:K+-transporting ATPase ATPase A chain